LILMIFHDNEMYLLTTDRNRIIIKKQKSGTVPENEELVPLGFVLLDFILLDFVLLGFLTGIPASTKGSSHYRYIT